MTRFWRNPLFARNLATWRRRWPLALLALAALSGLTYAYAELSAAPSRFTASGTLYWSLAFLVLGLPVLIYSAALSAPIALPVAATNLVERLRARGGWSLLRITTLDGWRIVDGLLMRLLLQVPVWIPVLPVTGLYLATQLDELTHSIRYLDTPALRAMYFTIVACRTLYMPAVALSTAEVGLAIAVVQPSRPAALGGIFAALVILQVLVPIMLGLSPLCPVATLFGNNPFWAWSYFPYDPGAITYALLFATAALVYQLGLFFGARSLAARRIEEPEA